MRSIELFAGAGGLGIGLHRAGFHPGMVVEWDHDCCVTVRENQAFEHPVVRDWPLIEDDVRRVDFSAFEDRLHQTVLTQPDLVVRLRCTLVSKPQPAARNPIQSSPIQTRCSPRQNMSSKYANLLCR